MPDDTGRRTPEGLSQPELEQIMRALDENLALELAGGGGPQPAEASAGQPRADIALLAERLRRLRRISAPLFAVEGGGAGSIVRRLLNVPIRVFGHKQKFFNDELLDTLDAALDALGAMGSRLEQQERELRELRERLGQRAPADE